MVRSLTILLLLPATMFAQDPPKSASISMLFAKIEGGKLLTTSTVDLPKNVTVAGKDGNTKSITVIETTTTTVSRDLKYFRAATANGKEVKLDDLMGLLKDPSPVVLANTPLDEAWKKKLKPGTLILEYVEPAAIEPKKP